MLRGGSPATWHRSVHGIAVLLIIATSVLAPLTMALAVRGDPSRRPIAVASVVAGALFVVFLLVPWETPHSCRRSSPSSPGLQRSRYA
jgi:NADH:ubiquinone oxidoreductase subunit 4 (subunit M)